MCILRYKPDQYSKLMPTALFRMEDSIGNPLKSQLYIEFPQHGRLLHWLFHYSLPITARLFTGAVMLKQWVSRIPRNRWIRFCFIRRLDSGVVSSEVDDGILAGTPLRQWQRRLRKRNTNSIKYCKITHLSNQDRIKASVYGNLVISSVYATAPRHEIFGKDDRKVPFVYLQERALFLTWRHLIWFSGLFPTFLAIVNFISGLKPH